MQPYIFVLNFREDDIDTFGFYEKKKSKNVDGTNNVNLDLVCLYKFNKWLLIELSIPLLGNHFLKPWRGSFTNSLGMTIMTMYLGH